VSHAPGIQSPLKTASDEGENSDDVFAIPFCHQNRRNLMFSWNLHCCSTPHSDCRKVKVETIETGELAQSRKADRHP
jgi:hypothetical protein